MCLVPTTKSLIKLPGIALLWVWISLPLLAAGTKEANEELSQINTAQKNKADKSDLLKLVAYPVNARITALLELSKSDVVQATTLLPKVVELSGGFNEAEHYLVYMIRANIAADQGLYSQAIEWQERAKALMPKIAEEQLNTPLFFQLHLDLAASYAAQKQYEPAFSERKEYKEKYKAYLKAKKEQTIADLNDVYETGQKEKENQILVNENRLKQLQIKEAQRNKEIQQRNMVILICTAVVFFLLMLRQMRIRNILNRLAQTDSLTGLLNRGTLFKRGQKLLDQSIEQQQELSAILLDIDHFKGINDNYGHDVGDKVINLVASLGGETMRSRDVFARLGGEEFVAILPEACLEEAKAIAERFREKILSCELSELGIERAISASFGVVSLSQVEPEFDALIHAADEAMYQAKNNGRNQVCSYQPNSATPAQ